MSNRTLRSLNVSLKECLENTNLWATKACDLIRLKRSILRNKHIDSKFYLLAKAFNDVYYNENVSDQNVYEMSAHKTSHKTSHKVRSSRRPVLSDNSSYYGTSEEDSPKSHKKKYNTESEEDITDTLRREAATIKKQITDKQNNKRKNEEKTNKRKSSTSSDSEVSTDEHLKNIKLTDFQRKSLEALKLQEKESNDMGEYIMQRRKQMQEDMKHPPKSKIKFTLSADSGQTAKPNDDLINSSDYETVDEETVNEETVDEETVDEETVDEETVNEETVNEETVNEETVDEETVDEETVNEETVNEETVNEENTSNIDKLSHRTKSMLEEREDNLADMVAKLSSLHTDEKELKDNENDTTATENDTTATENDTPATENDTPATENDTPATENDIPATENDIPATENDIKSNVNFNPVEGTMNNAPKVVFKTPDAEPPNINALTRLSVSERNRLLERLYMQAKNNINEQCHNIKNKQKIQKLIREECNRLLQDYIDMN